jgi:hypothetical protein
MTFFTPQNQASNSNSGRYSPVSATDEENKPLHITHEHLPPSDDGYAQHDRHDQDHLATTREIYALSASLRRTNLFLKIIIGLLCFTIIALLSMNVPDTVRKMIKSTTCASERLLKTPVPPLVLETKVFEKTEIYSQRPNKESDAAWDALLPVCSIIFAKRLHEKLMSSRMVEDSSTLKTGHLTTFHPVKTPATE